MALDLRPFGSGTLRDHGLVEGLLFGVSPSDPLTHLVVVVVLTTVAAVACWIPARRAANVDPVVALRHE